MTLSWRLRFMHIINFRAGFYMPTLETSTDMKHGLRGRKAMGKSWYIYICLFVFFIQFHCALASINFNVYTFILPHIYYWHFICGFVINELMWINFYRCKTGRDSNPCILTELWFTELLWPQSYIQWYFGGSWCVRDWPQSLLLADMLSLLKSLPWFLCIFFKWVCLAWK